MLRPFKKNSNIKGDNLEYNLKAYKVKNLIYTVTFCDSHMIFLWRFLWTYAHFATFVCLHCFPFAIKKQSFSLAPKNVILAIPKIHLFDVVEKKSTKRGGFL